MAIPFPRSLLLFFVWSRDAVHVDPREREVRVADADGRVRKSRRDDVASAWRATALAWSVLRLTSPFSLRSSQLRSEIPGLSVLCPKGRSRLPSGL
jgi:hypothetical protein